jgi:tetracycline 7-halogenase / FADH2 O2-dependent halogenase
MRRRFQVVVVGSGFGGTLTAMIAHRLGLSTALIERGRHPRFAIGESSTPLANLLLQEIAEDYDLPSVRPLCKWGTWQKQTPQIPCGLKRGFTFYHHQLGQRFAPDPERRRQLMVGASTHEEIADTHWYRPRFDEYLVDQAQALGVTYWDEVQLDSAVEGDHGIRLTGKRRGEPVNLDSEFVIDASGSRGFLHRAFRLPEKPFATMPPTQALFSHFTGVGSLPDCFQTNGDAPPYPPEQAAVHHVFPGGWVWVLKFNNGVTSAGVAATDRLGTTLGFQSGEVAWQKLMAQLPSLDEMFGSARATLPFVYQPRLAFRSGVITGRNWALLPSAAGVIDPLLSTGFPLTLLGVTRLGRILKSHWQRDPFGHALEEYAQLTALELETTARLVGTLYASMEKVEIFNALSLLYFAAASFSEAARRLGKAPLADGFLLCGHPDFSKHLRQLCQTSREELSPVGIRTLRRQIREAIEPFDVAGLGDRSRDPWYPALTADLLRGAPKLHVRESDVAAMLQKELMNSIGIRGMTQR